MHANKRNGVFLVAFSVLFFGVVQARAQGSLPTGSRTKTSGRLVLPGAPATRMGCSLSTALGRVY